MAADSTKVDRVVSVTLIVTIVCALMSAGCIARRPECSRTSDCARGACSRSGFCVTECVSDVDCPGGARCAPCGLCVADGRLASCFGVLHGIADTTNRCEVLDAGAMADPALVTGPLDLRLELALCDGGAPTSTDAGDDGATESQQDAGEPEDAGDEGSDAGPMDEAADAGTDGGFDAG